MNVLNEHGKGNEMNAQANTEHPANREYGVNVFALKAGDILTRDGNRYQVCEGFDKDQSTIWKDSRWVRCVKLSSSAHGMFCFVNPVGSFADVKP